MGCTPDSANMEFDDHADGDQVEIPRSDSVVGQLALAKGQTRTMKTE